MNVVQYVEKHVVQVRKKKDRVQDRVAIEEPLELRLAGDTVATTMRTPGHDFVLAKGFFFNEGFVTALEQIGQVIHCGRPGTEDFGNVVDVLPAPGVLFNFEGNQDIKRGTLISASCGVCGRSQIEDLLKNSRPFDTFVPVAGKWVSSCVGELALNQPLFDITGGVHAAGAFNDRGDLVACFEDVGRHNATDKVIGHLFENGLIGKISTLVVSGRISFEIVQKAAMGRIPMLIGISAPTSLAIDLAEALRMTLVGFARDGRWTLYTGDSLQP